MILCDYALPTFNGMEALEIANRLAPWTPFLVVTGALDDAQAVSVLAAGADDYILKDRMARLGPAVQRAIENRRIRRENAAALQALRESEERYRRLFELESDAIVLVDNETGHVLEVNAAATTLYGYSREEWLRMNHADVSAEPDRTRQIRGRGGRPGSRCAGTASGTARCSRSRSRPRTSIGTSARCTWRRSATSATGSERRRTCAGAARSSSRPSASPGSGAGGSFPPTATLEWSEEMCRILGIDPGGAAPTFDAYRRLIHPDDREAFDASVQRCLRTGEAQEIDFRVVRPGGTIRHVVGRGELERDAEGHPIAFHGTVQDVTERWQGRDLETTLHGIFKAAQAARSLTELFEALHAIVGRLLPAPNFHFALLDIATGLVEFPYFVDETGAAPQPIKPGIGLTGRVLATGQPLLVSRDELEGLERRGEAVRSGRRSVQWLGVPLTVGGRVIGAMVLQSYSEALTYTDEDRDLVSSLSIAAAEAIERKRAEYALRESEARYRLLFNSSNDAVFVLRIAPDGSPGRFVEVNDVACRRLGYSREELLGMSPADIHTEETDAAVPAIMTRLQTEGRAVWEGVHVAKDGRTDPGRDQQPPVRSRRQAGDPGHGSGHHGAQAPGGAAPSCRRRWRPSGTSPEGVAHDFNNLLQAMLATVQSLRVRRVAPEAVAAELTGLEERIRRGAQLTRQLLIFSRREISTREIVDLNETIRTTGRMLRPLLRENVAFDLELPAARFLVRADRGQIEQVLMNLALNAVEAMPGGGTLAVRTGSEAGHAWIEVEDTGAGIPAAIRDRIFDPFFTTKPAGRGTGLGLSVVLGIVTSHGGSIRVESDAGKGARFRITLPAVGEGSVATPEPPADLGSGLEFAKGESVLLVEDEAGAREGLLEILTMLGYEVVAATSAEEAADRAAAQRFDLLLTDMMLPGRSGIDLAGDLLESAFRS